MTGKKQAKKLEDKSKATQDDEIIELKSEELKSVVAEIMVQQHFSGPIPPPEILSGYEQIHPGFADRIISMAEKQSAHRQGLEKIRVESEIKDSRLGVIFAFLMGISCLIAAILISVFSKDNAGVFIGGVVGVTGIGSIVGTFIYGTRLNK